MKEGRIVKVRKVEEGRKVKVREVKERKKVTEGRKEGGGN